MGNTDPDALIARLAARHHHLVTRRHLRTAGLTSRQIDRRIASALLVPLHPGVYLLGGGSPAFEQRVLAAAWAARGLASHCCAARLFRLRRIEAAAVETTVARAKAPVLAGVLCHRSAVLPASERATVAGIPATTPARVLLDICDTLTPAVFEGALDDVLVRRLASLHTIHRMLERTDGRGRPGIRLFRELVGARRAGVRPTESPLEDDLVALIRRYGLPEPDRQVPVKLADGKEIRLDVAYVARRLDLEADGDEYHSGLLDRKADAERDRLCGLAGWTVRRFTSADIRQRPEAVAAAIADLLGLRRAS